MPPQMPSLQMCLYVHAWLATFSQSHCCVMSHLESLGTSDHSVLDKVTSHRRHGNSGLVCQCAYSTPSILQAHVRFTVPGLYL